MSFIAVVIPEFRIGVGHLALSAPAIAQAHRAGLRIAAYTVDDPARARELLGQGLDLLVTDEPGLLLA